MLTSKKKKIHSYWGLICIILQINVKMHGLLVGWCCEILVLDRLLGDEICRPLFIKKKKEKKGKLLDKLWK